MLDGKLEVSHKRIHLHVNANKVVVDDLQRALPSQNHRTKQHP
jgi:hypothetical protein